MKAINASSSGMRREVAHEQLEHGELVHPPAGLAHRDHCGVDTFVDPRSSLNPARRSEADDRLVRVIRLGTPTLGQQRDARR